MNAEKTPKKISSAYAHLRLRLLGLLLLALAFSVLYFAEKYVLSESNVLGDVAKNIVQISNIHTLNSEFDGKIVYAQGRVTASELVHDSLLGLEAKGLGLVRRVQYFQWEKSAEGANEQDGTRKEINGDRYIKSWMDEPQSLINDEKNNILIYEVENATLYAQQARLGAYKVVKNIVQKIEKTVPFTPQLTQDELEKLHIAVLAASERSDERSESIEQFYDDWNNGREYLLAHMQGNEIFLGAKRENPAAGDVRISLALIAEQEVSVIAKVNRDRLEPFKTANGKETFILVPGKVTLQDMLLRVQETHDVALWILRLLCVAGMCVALRMLLTVR